MNILVVNVNWVGDVIFSSPVFRALRRAHPQARIACLAVPRVVPILESIPEIDEVIVYDEKGKDYWLWRKAALIRRLKKERFDAAYLLHRSWTRALLTMLAGIPVRVGTGAKNRERLLTQVIPMPDKGLHRRDHYLHVIESAGVSVEDRTTRLTVDAEARAAVEDLLASNGITPASVCVVVNTGGNWDLKRWPAEYFTQLIGELQKDPLVRVVIPGAPKDVTLATSIAAGLDRPPVILAGQTNLKELIALMARADLVISNDSGPLHIAHSVGTDVVALFGPTRPELTGPVGSGRCAVLQKDVGCNQQACYNLTCPDNVCMQAVTVEDVLAAFRSLRERTDEHG